MAIGLKGISNVSDAKSSFEIALWVKLQAETCLKARCILSSWPFEKV